MDMQSTLMNFGDNIRVINDPSNRPMAIPVGAVMSCDVHEVHLKMLQDGLARETLIVVDQDMVEKTTPKLKLAMECLRDLNSEDYDGVLERFNTINGPNPNDLRPTRGMLRIALREIARQEVQKLFMQRAQRVTIHEQGDERTRQEPAPPPPPPPPPQNDPPPKVKKQKGPEEIKVKRAAPVAEKTAGKAKKKIVRERL